MTSRDDSLKALRMHDQWLCWKQTENKKIPIAPFDSRRKASVDDPDTCGTYAVAKAYHERSGTGTDGLGFMLTSTDRIAGADLDDCRNPVTGAIEPWARYVYESLDSYTEISPSGTGIRVFVLGSLPEGGNRSDIEGADGHIELYDSARYLTFTGNRLDGTPNRVHARSDELESIHREYVADNNECAQNRQSTDTQNPNGNVSLGDRELLEKARDAANGRKFSWLYDNGDTSSYPSHSEARMSLLNMLAFWTGKDRQQMDRLFRNSALYPHPSKPGKWDRLGDDEIQKAIRHCSDTYSGRTSSVLPSDSGGSVSSDGGRPIVGTPIISHVTDALREQEAAKTAEIMEYPTIDRSRKQVERALQFLESENVIEWDRQGRSVVYRLTDDSK